MRTNSLICSIFLLLGTLVAFPQTNYFPILNIGTNTYLEAHLKKISPTDCLITTDDAWAKVAFSNLPPAIQKQFGYDPEKAKVEIAALQVQSEKHEEYALKSQRAEASRQADSDVKKYFDFTYDRFTDLVTVSQKKVMRFKFSTFEEVAVSVFYLVSPTNPFPDKIILRIGSVSSDWKFLKDHSLICLYDNQRNDRGEIAHDGEVFDGGVSETMQAEFTLYEMGQMAYAKSLEMKLGGIDFEFPAASRIQWQVLDKYFKNLIHDPQ